MANLTIPAPVIAQLAMLEFSRGVKGCGVIHYADCFAPHGAKLGSTVNVVLDSQAYNDENGIPHLRQSHEPVEVKHRFQVRIDVSTRDLALQVNRFASQFIEPAGRRLASDLLRWWPLGSELACVDLPLPGGVDMAERVVDPEVGLSLRLVRMYDMTQDRMLTYLDYLVGHTKMDTPAEIMSPRLARLHAHKQELLQQCGAIHSRRKASALWTP